MYIVEIVSTIVATLVAIVGILSFFYRLFVLPIKNTVSQIRECGSKVEILSNKIDNIGQLRIYDNTFDNEVRQLLIESLVAILDVLDKVDSSKRAYETKQRLLTFLSSKVKYSNSA